MKIFLSEKEEKEFSDYLRLRKTKTRRAFTTKKEKHNANTVRHSF